MIVTGIFWVVRGEIVADKHVFEAENTKKEFMDFPFSHFDLWDKLSKKRFPYADFATFSRGRLLYCVREKRYYLYLDACITQSQTERLLLFFGLEKDEVCIARDEHYRCDRCLKKAFRGEEK